MEFSELKQILTKDVLTDLYINQKLSKDKIMKTYKIGSGRLDKLLKEYNLNRSKSEINSFIKGSSFQILLNTIDLNEFKRLYLEENKPQSYLIQKYNISSYICDKIINTLKINKPRKQSSVLGNSKKYDKYGSKEAYQNHIKQKSVETFINKDKSLEAHYRKVADKVKNTKIKKYGTLHYYNYDKCKQTCLEKYGVEYPCQRKEARDNISNNSKINQEFASLLTRENIEFEREFSLGSKSFDFKVKDILIEINPTITHNSTFSPFKNNKGQDPKYHQEKSILAETNGFRCIHVWDWDDKEKIINSLKTKKKIYARDCVIKELNKEDTDTFLNKYHFQNTCKNQTIRIGLFSNNELVQVISFGKPRFNKNYQYELLRLCTKFDYIIIGGSEKLFKYFINKYKPESIISYCDRSKFKGDVYQSLGFTLINKGIPTKHWYNLKTKKHLLDSSLRARGFDILLGKEYGCFGKGTSNNELMLKHGFVEIYDCGQASYKYIR